MNSNLIKMVSDVQMRNGRICPRPKMIVFDKDGTLGDCSPALQNWCDRMTFHIRREYQSHYPPTAEFGQSSLKNNTNTRSEIDDILSTLYKALGWDSQKQCLQPSAPLAAGTWEEILSITTKVLIDCGLFDNDDISSKVRYWHENLGNIHGNDEPLVDLPALMGLLREKNLLVSICTSDDRKATNQCISSWNLDGLIDVSSAVFLFSQHLFPKSCDLCV